MQCTADLISKTPPPYCVDSMSCTPPVIDLCGNGTIDS